MGIKRYLYQKMKKCGRALLSEKMKKWGGDI